MNELSIIKLEELSILNFKNKNKLRTIYNNALLHSNLSIIDYMTIRDMLILSGYDDIYIHIILICMFMSLLKGSICIKIDERSLQDKISIFNIKETDNIAKNILTKIDKYPDLIYTEIAQNELFHDNKNEFKPLILIKNKNSNLLYFQKYYYAEKKLKSKLLNLIKFNHIEKINPDIVKKITDEILITNPIFFNNSPANFNNEQTLAMMIPTYHNLSIISGGPGTGKTSIIINLIRMFVRLGIPVEKIKISAPTGRAAQKISESILQNLKSLKNINDTDKNIEKISSSTIHRLLKYDPGTNSFHHNSKNKIDADVLIIDEISMVDAIILSKLLDAVEDNTRVIFLGDRNQLPSIEAGAILADLIPDETKISYSDKFIKMINSVLQKKSDHFNDKIAKNTHLLQNMVVLLQKNFRSEKSIQKFSNEINNQDISAIDEIPVLKTAEFKKDSIPLLDCNIINWPDPNNYDENLKSNSNTGVFKIYEENNNILEIHAIFSSWINHQFINRIIKNEKYLDLITEISEYKLNKFINKRAIEILEKLFIFIDHAKILSPLNSGLTGTSGINSFIIKIFHKKFDSSSNAKVFSGMPIMITKNDYGKNLFNGDTGIILRQKDNQYYGIFMRSGEFISYPIEMLNSYKPAFAITVHKSQGSEYNEVLFIIPESTPEKMISKEIIYTGITRAKDLIVLYSTDEKLKKGTMEKIERESGIIFDS